MRRTYVLHFHRWKQRFMHAYFPDRDFVFIPRYEQARRLEKHWLPRIIAERADVFVWSTNIEPWLAERLRGAGLEVTHIEDGFLRSSQPSASRTWPLSLALDRRRPYFDATGPSDLERLLEESDLQSDDALMARASEAIDLLIASGLSKYNTVASIDAIELYGPKTAERILVIGQVEDDMSIRYGADRKLTNNDLVRQARADHPQADIIYRPHPDVLHRVRARGSDPREVATICRIVTAPVPLAQALQTIDRVYTITSLAGFEALLRGIPVTTLGCPFYSGWGLTDDRQPNTRRTRRHSIEAVFAAAYLLYPRYFDPSTGAELSFETALQLLRDELERSAKGAGDVPAYPAGPDWQPFGAYGLLGWRHALTPLLAPVIAKIGNDKDARIYREDPIGFFRELSDPRQRFIGRLLYPFDERRP